MEKIELLAPAGDLEKLKMAINYGADAIYLAGEEFGMRTASKNFSFDDLKEGIEYSHKRNKKIYVTVNILPHNSDLEGFDDYVKSLIIMGVDALIVSDPGIYSIIREIDKDIEVHWSTQASVTNYKTVEFWKNMGVKRVVLARELSLKEIHEIKNKVPDITLENFVHGAMCISYSGRCLLSNYMIGRDANRGDCAHACRWKYNIVEEKRPGEYFPIIEDEKGTYIYNSKDLCMIDSIPDLIKAGINSFKIEGRVKSSYYVATVIRAYRIAIDAYYSGEYTNDLVEYLIKEIRKASHRDFTKGFYYKKPDSNDQLYETTSYIRDYDFVALVKEYDHNTQMATLEQRNRVFLGDELEIFGPDKEFKTIKIEKMTDINDKDIDVMPRPKELFKIKIDFPVNPMDILRKKK